MRKNPQPSQSHHSRSLSSRSDLNKNSARNRLGYEKQQGLPLTKKEKEIREAIEYRFKKSKMRDYEIEPPGDHTRSRKHHSRSHSSQMVEFREMRTLKVVNLKEFHERVNKKKLDEKERNSLKNVLKIRTNSGMNLRTEGS